jgi:hypothetical protein
MVDVVPGSSTSPAMRAHIERVRWSNRPATDKVRLLTAIVDSRTTDELRDLARRYRDAVADEQRAVEDFPWPCDRREAHGGHEVPVCTCASTEGTLRTCSVHGEEQWLGTETRWCPGVKAYPLTMIGRAYHGG